MKTKALRLCGGLSRAALVVCLCSGILSAADQAYVSSGAVWKYFDAGAAPASGWEQPAFNDSLWASGPSQLGFGDGDERTVLHGGIVTAYFRTRFNVVGAGAVSGLTLRVLRDDGAAIYLNGVEVWRNNLPAGALTYTTLATVAVGGAEETTLFLSAALDPGLLLEGENVIAAEVHQVNITSSDLSFDLELLSNSGAPPPELPVITVLTVDPTASESTGNPGQIDRGLVRLVRTGPTNDALHVGLEYDGAAVNGVDYLLLPPSVDLAAGVTSIDLVIEPVNDNIHEGIENVVVRAVQPACANQASPGAGCFRVGTPAQAQVSILDDDPELPAETTALIARGSIWKYLDTGVDLGTNWRSPGFDDAQWASGPGQLGYGDGDEMTVVSFGPDPTSKYITTYFRRAFTVTNRLAYSNLVMQVLRDDGVVIYLNGAEVHRNNMPAGAITFRTLAVSVNPDENAYVDAAVSPLALVNGRNVIAAEVHQANVTSSDLGFDLALLANSGVAPADTNPPPNLPPIVVLLAPTNGAVFQVAGAIPFRAHAQDPDGDAIAGIEFLANGQSLGPGVSNPAGDWSLVVSNLPAGNYAITAAATDSRGLQGVSVAVQILVQGAVTPGDDRELHLVGVYSGAGTNGGSVPNHEFGDGLVQVDRPGKRVSLFLLAYEPVHWHVTTSPGTVIERVFLSGNYIATVDGISAGTPVTTANVGYAFQLESTEYLQLLPRICGLTGQDAASFHGAYTAPWHAPFVIDSVQADPRLRCGYPFPETNNLPALSFRMAFFGSGRGIYFQDYTVQGPVGSAKLLPDDYCLPDSGGRYFYTADPHDVEKIDSQTGSVLHMQLPPELPELSWPMGAAYDPVRQRVLLVSLGGEGFLYGYAPSNDSWRVVTSMNNLDLDSLVYHGATDRLFGIGIMYGDGGPTLHELSADGAPQRSFPLPVLPWRLGPGGIRSELVSVGDYLFWLMGPRYTWDSNQESRMYLIDPRTGEVRLTYRQPGPPAAVDTDGDGVVDADDQCPDTPAGSIVDAHGCSLEQLCPCNAPWEHPIDYLGCVIRNAWNFYRAGLITVEQRREAIRDAVLAHCGPQQPIRILPQPQTPEEVEADGREFIVAGDGIAACVLECSPDLRHWIPVQTNLAVNADCRIADPRGNGDAARLYRVRVLPP